MVNAEMFANHIPSGIKPVSQRPQPVAYYEDPEVAKLKLLLLKGLTIIVGGAAVLLIIWRVILKFI